MKIAILMTDKREMLRCYTAPSPEFGTAPQALLQGFEKLSGAEVHVISCVKKPVPSTSQLASNIFFHPLVVPGIGWLRTAYQGCIRSVRRCLARIDPDVVHGQGTERDNALAAAFSGRPNLVTIHGNMVDIAQALRARPGTFHWLTAILESIALRLTSGVLCNSAYTEARVRTRARKTWRVPNAVRLPFFDQQFGKARRSPCTLLHIGTVCEYKQQLEVLELARRLHAQGLKFEFWFIGDAPSADRYAQEFCARVRAAQQRGFARYLGDKPVGELIECLDEASAIVHTPTVESFGLVVAEALARNLTFFGLKVGGVPDIIAGAPDAVLVEPADWIGLERQIAAWLLKGAPHPEPTAGLMRARYHPVAVAQRHLEIYEEILAKRLCAK